MSFHEPRDLESDPMHSLAQPPPAALTIQNAACLFTYFLKSAAGRSLIKSAGCLAALFAMLFAPGSASAQCYQPGNGNGIKTGSGVVVGQPMIVGDGTNG